MTEGRTCLTPRTWCSSLPPRSCWRCCRSTLSGTRCGTISIRDQGSRRGSKTLRQVICAFAILASLLRAVAAEEPSETPAAAQELFRYANLARARAGSPPLEWNQWLAQAARKHAQLMVEHKQLSHDFPGESDLRARLIATGLRFD